MQFITSYLLNIVFEAVLLDGNQSCCNLNFTEFILTAKYRAITT